MMRSLLTVKRVTIITALRVAALGRVNSTDFTYDQSYLGLLSTVGALIAVICSNVIAVQMLIRRFIERIVWDQSSQWPVCGDLKFVMSPYSRLITRPATVYASFRARIRDETDTEALIPNS